MKLVIFSKLFSLTLMMGFLLIGIDSCQKGKKSVKTNTTNTNDTTSLDFTYTGNLFVYDTISFHSTASSTSMFLWKFGDGTISHLPTPTHIYSIVPFLYTSNYPLNINVLPDTVVLVVNNDTLHPVIKYLQLMQIHPPVSIFVGTHTWRHFYYGGSYDSLYYIYEPDTTLAIASIDSLRLNVFGNILIYIPNTNWNFSNELPPYDYPFCNLSYNSSTDSIVIRFNLDPTALGGEWLEYFCSH